MHLIDTFIPIDSVEKLLLRLLDHSNLVVVVDEVAELLQVCRKEWIFGQTGWQSAEHLGQKLSSNAVVAQEKGMISPRRLVRPGNVGEES